MSENMGVEVTIEMPENVNDPEPVTPVAPTVIVVESGESETMGEAELAELIELREYKAKVEEERLARIESDAATALILSQIAVETPPVEPVEVEPIVVEETPDNAPKNDHPFFRQW